MWLLMITLMLRFQWTNIRWWPPWRLSKSRRLSFNYLTGHSILSALDGLRWAIPGTVIHSGACDGSWFFGRKRGSSKRDTTSCHWVRPLENAHLPGAMLNALRYEHRLPEANASRITVFMVRHFREMTSSENSPWISHCDANGSLNKNKGTRWRSHLGTILCCTGHSSRKALISSLMCGSAAGS